MGKFKIHTSNVGKVMELLSEIGLKGNEKINYHKFIKLNNEHYFNLPEMKW